MILCLSTTICACGNDAPKGGTYDSPKLVSKEELNAQQEQEEQQAQPQEEQKDIEETSSDNGAINDTCTVAIKDYVLSTDMEGKDVIIVNFDFSNSDSEGKSFSVSTSTKAFQDGIELSHAYFIDNEYYNSENSLKQVRDGATIAVQEAFELNNLTSPVEASDMFDFLGKSETLKKTFELQ